MHELLRYKELDEEAVGNKIVLYFYAIIVVVFFSAVLGIPSLLTNWVVQFLISAMVSSIFSLVIGQLVEAFTGNWLKRIMLTVRIFGYKFSVTAFAIVVYIIQTQFFGL